MSNDKFIRITNSILESVNKTITHMSNRTYEHNERQDIDTTLTVLNNERKTLEMVIQHAQFASQK